MPKTVKVSRGRDVLEIPEDRIGDAQSRGYQLVDDAGAKRIATTKDAAGLAGGARGLAGSFASGVTFGGTNAALVGLGADAEQLKADQEGGVGVVGEVAGAVVPALLTGGAGALGTVARATPAGRAAMIGAKAGKAAGAAVKGAGSVARAGVALGTEGAVEGAIQGASQAVAKSFVDDVPLTAESVVAGAGEAAGLGALFGGALGAAGGGLVSAARGGGKAAGAMLRRAPEAADGLQGAAISASAREKTIRAWAKVAGVDEGAMSRSIDRLGTNEGAARMVGNLDATREKVARSLKVGVDDANDAWDDLIKTTGGDARIGNAERLMTPAENAVAPRHALDFLRGESKRIDNALGDELLTKAMRRDLKEIKRQNEVAMRTVRERGSGAEAFRAVDRYKQDIATIARSRGDEFARGAVREVGEAAKLARGFDDAARAHLFDEAIYGAAGKAHRESSAAWSLAIDAASTLRKKDPKVGALFKRGAEEADLDTMLRLARKYTRAGGETKASAFDAAIDARIAAVKKLRENHDLAPEVAAKIDRFEGSVTKMRKELAEQAEHASAVDDLWKLRQAETNGSPSQSVFSTAGPLVAGMVGSALGGPIGAAAGAIAGHALAPSRVLRTAASLRGVVDKVNFDMGGAVAAFGRLADGAKRPSLPSGSSVARAARTAAQTQDAKKQRDAGLKRTVENVEQLASDPMMLADQLRDDDLDELSPELSGRTLMVAARATQFLQSKRPTSYKPTFGGGAELFDPIEMDKYERFVEAVTRPMEAAARLGDGTMTVEHAEALKFVYPMLYNKMQGSIMEELGEREARGIPVRFEARVQLGVLGDVPADDSLRPSSLLAIAGAHADSAAAAAAEHKPVARGGGLRKSDLAMPSMQTERARLALGGESS